MFKFPNAADSKNISELRAIHTEICAIETAILDAREDGLRTVTVCNTAMTMSVDHWNAFQSFQNQCGIGVGSTDEQKNLLGLQNQIIACFESLGYSIARVTNTNTGNTFCWELKW